MPSPLNRKINFEKNKVGGLTLPHSNNYYEAIVIKRVWYSLPNDREID